MDQEPHHHVLFKNESVEIVRATLLPGESTLFHIHSYDSAGFDFVASTTTEQLFGQAQGPASDHLIHLFAWKGFLLLPCYVSEIIRMEDELFGIVSRELVIICFRETCVVHNAAYMLE